MKGSKFYVVLLLLGVLPLMGAMCEKKDTSMDRVVEVGIYNRFINGDWKRQDYYKPSRERIARIVRYEWKNYFSDLPKLTDSEVSHADIQAHFLEQAKHGVPAVVAPANLIQEKKQVKRNIRNSVEKRW